MSRRVNQAWAEMVRQQRGEPAKPNKKGPKVTEISVAFPALPLTGRTLSVILRSLESQIKTEYLDKKCRVRFEYKDERGRIVVEFDDGMQS